MINFFSKPDPPDIVHGHENIGVTVSPPALRLSLIEGKTDDLDLFVNLELRDVRGESSRPGP